ARCGGVVDSDGLVGDGRCCVGDDDLPDVPQPGVVQVDVEHLAGHAVVLRHADDEESAQVIGEGADVLGQFLAAPVVWTVVVLLVVEIFTLGCFGTAHELGDAPVVQFVEPPAEQALDPAQSRHHVQTLLTVRTAAPEIRTAARPQDEQPKLSSPKPATASASSTPSTTAAPSERGASWASGTRR